MSSAENFAQSAIQNVKETLSEAPTVFTISIPTPWHKIISVLNMKCLKTTARVANSVDHDQTPQMRCLIWSTLFAQVCLYAYLG